MQTATQETVSVTVHHHRMVDPDDEESHHPVGKHLIMGMEWCEERDVDPAEHVGDEYTFENAGTIEVPRQDGETATLSYAYEQWDLALTDQIDRTQVRGIAVGDVFEMDGNYWLVDRIGFERLDVEADE